MSYLLTLWFQLERNNPQISHLPFQTSLRSVRRRSAPGARSGPELSRCSKAAQNIIINLLPLRISKVCLISHVQMSGNTKMWIVKHTKWNIEEAAFVSDWWLWSAAESQYGFVFSPLGWHVGYVEKNWLRTTVCHHPIFKRLLCK